LLLYKAAAAELIYLSSDESRTTVETEIAEHVTAESDEAGCKPSIC
jgi:hypothetical protein